MASGITHVATAANDAEHFSRSSPDESACRLACCPEARGDGLQSKDLIHEVLSKANLNTPPVREGHTDDLSDVNPYAALVGDPSRSHYVVDTIVGEDRRADRAVACMVGEC